MTNASIKVETKGRAERIERLIKPKLKVLADKISSFAPSDANIDLYVKRCSKIVKTKCRVSSMVGIFETEVKNKNPNACLEKVEQQILEKIRVWQSQRYFTET